MRAGADRLTEERISALAAAEQGLLEKNFAPYLKLRDLLNEKSGESRTEFCKIFKSFYMMRKGTGVAPEFEKRFFDILFSYNPSANPRVAFIEIATELAKIDNPKEKKTVHFSFVSKLVAMHNEASPIYDKHVRNFFGERLPANGAATHERIDAVADFLESVGRIYTGWASDPEIAKVLGRMCDRDPRLCKCHPVRLIDFLVWRHGNLFQGYLRNSASTAL